MGVRPGVPSRTLARLAPALGSAILLVAAGAAPAAGQSRTGGALYAARCADCHGADATGVNGPDLTRLWASGWSDDDVFRTIRAGVPGSIMPSSSAPDDEIRAIVAYLRSLGRTVSSAATWEGTAGDADRGEEIFRSTCASCHRVSQEGGRLGPDLSRIAGARSREDVARAIREASASIAEGFRSVTFVTRDGRRIQGITKGEDAFSIQIMDTEERLQGYRKADLREVIRHERSLMPDYGRDRLGDGDLDDLLEFLGTSRAARGPGAQEAPPRGPADQDLLEGLEHPDRWLTYHGDYSGRRHSPLTRITPENVHRLAAQWTFQTGTLTRGRGFETSPLLWDGVLYVTGSNNFAWALDARTGRPFWRYRRDLPDDLTYGAMSPVNRGFAVLGDRLFMVTLDAHLLAFDRITGDILWDVVLADYRIGYAATVAPLVVEGKVIVGISGGEYPTRGFLDAYDPETGRRLWRFDTIPGPGEPGSETWPASAEVLERGRGATWTTGTYDPELDLIYWATGNPNPDFYGGDRKGDNLYTNSLLALDAETGRLRWYYQFTPHDTHDWDANQIPVLADIELGGRQRRVVLFANRNGFFYVLDRVTGELLLGKPFTGTTWAREIGPDGRPVVLNDGSEGCLPEPWGGTNFMPPSFDPSLGLFFVTARETCVTYIPRPQEIVPGELAFAGVVQRGDRSQEYGALRAIDVRTGERRWEFRYPTPSMAGVMSTASGLVFAGDNEGNFMAFDARTGKPLWHHSTGSAIWGAAAITYMLDGRQYVVIPSGATLVAFALPDAADPR